MKRFGIFLFGVIVVGLVVYAVPSLRNRVVQGLSYSECNSPLSYRLGSIDPKFGLGKDEVLQDMRQATDIWASAEGKQLFTYDPSASLVVNFTYDARSALNSQISNLQSQLSQNDATLREQIASYEAQVSAFKQKLAAFNAEVAKYNSQGGAPKDVYDSLIKQQQELNAEGDALNQMAKQLNLSENSYNYNVSVYNGDVSQFNQEIAVKPEEGKYDGLNDTITIYFADNKQELVHTLAHEFGHALGMGHVGNVHAIMYASTSTNLQVTPDDMQQLVNVCRQQSIILHAFEVVDMWITTLLQSFSQNFAK